MFQAVFADDEIIVREGIQRRVDWAGRGFSLAGVYANGSQVVEHLKKHPDVDLVISDICMPGMDGLELSRFISEEHPHISVLLLTGFDEFEYAQEAIKYHVKELLLKPITAKELEEVLTQAHADISRERTRHLEQEQMKEQLRQSMPVLRERFLNRLVSGKIPESRIDDELAAYELPGQAPRSLCVLLEIAPAKDDVQSGVSSDIDSLRVFDACSRLLMKDDMLFYSKDEQPVFILQQQHEKGLVRRSRELCTELMKTLQEGMHLTVTFGVGRCRGNLSEIQKSYKDAQKALSHQFILGKNRIIAADELDFAPHDLSETRKDLEDALIRSLKTQPPEHSRSILGDFFTETFADHISLPFARIQIHLLLSTIIAFLEEAGIPVMDVFSEPEDEFILSRPMLGREDVEDWFYQFIDRIHEHISRRSMDPTQQKILQACRYIGEHYREKDLNMQTICRELSISPSHFSAHFKQTTGKTFVEYLTAVRIQQASMLLKTTNLCAYEIADTVGYEDAHYFSLVFKKHAGMTVREYRRMLNEAQEEVT